jgi:hypothetical protein
MKAQFQNFVKFGPFYRPHAPSDNKRQDALMGYMGVDWIYFYLVDEEKFFFHINSPLQKLPPSPRKL